MPRRRSRLVEKRYADLARYIAESGDSQANIARRVGASQAHISRIASGRAVPRPLLALRLAQYCKIPISSFSVAFIRQKGDAA